MFGLDYAEVGGELLNAWRLPASLEEPLRFQNAPQDAETYAMEAAIVHIAALIAPAQATMDTPLIAPDIVSLAGLDDDAIDAVIAQLDLQTGEALTLLFPVHKSA